MENNLKAHRCWFDGFAAKKISEAKEPAPLELKVIHTHHVLANALKIAETLPNVSKEAAFLAALYHDIGRFDQYLRFGTFKDAQSLNHGSQAVKIVKKENRLANCDTAGAKVILTAIGLHNRAALPADLPEDHRILCEIVRDADKLDILRVMDEHLASEKPYNPTVILGLPDSPEPGNPDVIEAVLAKKVATYSQLRTLNDFRALLGSWFFDMHFESSRKIFKEAEHGRSLVLGLPANEHYGPARNMLLQALEKNAH